MVLLKVSYRLRAHHVADYERAFAEQTLPLIRDHGLDEKWRKLASDPRLKAIFETTGPLVEDEKLTIFEPALANEKTISLNPS